MNQITEALRAARACIQQDRTSLADTGMRHDNTMEPDAAAGVAEYDAVLQQIDAALAGMTHHITDEQIDATSADELLLKATPLADWSVDVFDDDEGRTYINIRNPDDDVAAAGVNTYVVGNRRTLASQVLHGFHQAFRAALTAAPTPPAQTAVPEDVARDAERYLWLRDMASQDWLHRNHNYQNLRGAAFDAAIDAARAAEKGGE